MKGKMAYVLVGMMLMLTVGLVIALTGGVEGGTLPGSDSGGIFREKYVAKLYVTVHRGTLDAWNVKIQNVDYEIDKTLIALDIGKTLSIFEGTYKVCARAYQNGFFTDQDCAELKLNPGDTKEATLSLNLGYQPTAKVKIVVYDEGGEIKDQREVDIS